MSGKDLILDGLEVCMRRRLETLSRFSFVYNGRDIATSENCAFLERNAPDGGLFALGGEHLRYAHRELKA